MFPDTPFSSPTKDSAAEMDEEGVEGGDEEEEEDNFNDTKSIDGDTGNEEEEKEDMSPTKSRGADDEKEKVSLCVPCVCPCVYAFE